MTNEPMTAKYAAELSTTKEALQNIRYTDICKKIKLYAESGETKCIVQYFPDDDINATKLEENGFKVAINDDSHVMLISWTEQYNQMKQSQTK